MHLKGLIKLNVCNKAWQHILRFIKLTAVDVIYHKLSIHIALYLYAKVARCSFFKRMVNARML